MIDVLDNKAIYAKIDALRKERGWTIYELAKRASISQTAIRHWRDENVAPSLALLEAVCSAFGINLLTFLMDENDLEANQEYLELWNGLTPQQQETVISVMKAMK